MPLSEPVCWVTIGGDLLDSRIVETQLTPLFDDSVVQQPTGLPLPRYLFNRLRTWQTILELNTPQTMALIRRSILPHSCLSTYAARRSPEGQAPGIRVLRKCRVWAGRECRSLGGRYVKPLLENSSRHRGGGQHIIPHSLDVHPYIFFDSSQTICEQRR